MWLINSALSVNTVGCFVGRWAVKHHEKMAKGFFVCWELLRTSPSLGIKVKYVLSTR